jgi:hypothetical protein
MVFDYRSSHIRRDIPVKMTEYIHGRGTAAPAGPGAQGSTRRIFLSGRESHREKVS